MNGVFYVLFGQGIVGTLDASQQDLTMVENLKPQYLDEVFLQQEVELHMLESQGICCLPFWIMSTIVSDYSTSINLKQPGKG